MLSLRARPSACTSPDFVFIEPLGGTPQHERQVVKPGIPLLGVELTNVLIAVLMRTDGRHIRFGHDHSRHLTGVIEEGHRYEVRFADRGL